METPLEAMEATTRLPRFLHLPITERHLDTGGGGGARLTVFLLLLGVKPVPEPKTPIIPFGFCPSVLGRPFT